MLEMIGIGCVTAIAFIILMFKIDIVFFAKYHWQTDIAVSAGLVFLFMGTFIGVIVSLTAGIIISIFLIFVRMFVTIPLDEDPEHET